MNRMTIFALLLQNGNIFVTKSFKNREDILEDMILLQQQKGIPWTIKYPPIQILWDYIIEDAVP